MKKTQQTETFYLLFGDFFLSFFLLQGKQKKNTVIFCFIFYIYFEYKKHFFSIFKYFLPNYKQDILQNLNINNSLFETVCETSFEYCHK